MYKETISRVPGSQWMLNKLAPCSQPGSIYMFPHGAWCDFRRTFSLIIWFLLSLKLLKSEVNLPHVETGNAQVLSMTARAVLRQSIIHVG